MKRTAIITLALLLLGCSNKSQRSDDIIEIDTGTAAEDADQPDGRLPDRCVESDSAWSAGSIAFERVDVGLEDANVTGLRISAVDFDDDGHTDLFLRRTGSDPDDFTGDRATWLMRNQGDGTFTDVTQESEIVRGRYASDMRFGRPAEVAAFADVDNDGDLDVVTAFSNDGSSNEGAELMLNDGDGTFSFGAIDLPFRREGTETRVGGLTWTDVDRDGRVDLWIAQGFGAPTSDILFKQDSDGGFADATAPRGLETASWTLGSLNAGLAHSNAWSSAACDLNGDGDPELLAASYGRSPNKLFVNDGGVFTDSSLASGYAADDRRDWSDNESARCWCTLNPDDEGCAGMAPPRITCEVNSDAFRWDHASDREPWRLGGNSGTTVCGDVDNDGDLDLLTTEIVHWDVGSSSDPSELLINDGNAVFSRPGNETTGLTRTHDGPTWDDGDITGALFDFDNDGRLDVLINSTDYAGTRAYLYHQRDDGAFEPVPLSEGIDHQSAHGVGIADFDRDGDLDVVLGHSRFRCSTGDHCYETAHARYFENKTGQDRNWVQLKLEGAEGTNLAAIGAHVTVEANGRLLTQEVGGGHGHYGIQHDLTLHFGLDAACAANVTVRWPDTDLSEQTFEVQAGYRYDVLQGAEPVPQQVASVN